MKRRGKIARLPREIRQELNERLHEDEIGKSLAEWLNGLPEVQAVLKAHFEGALITEQNISEWRKRGYAEWVEHEEALEVAVRLGERAQEWKGKDLPPMSEALAYWLMGQLLLATREVGQMEWEKRWPQVNKMFAHLMKLRRIEKEAQPWRSGEEERQDEREAMPPAGSAQESRTQRAQPAAAQAAPPASATGGQGGGEMNQHKTHANKVLFKGGAQKNPILDGSIGAFKAAA